MSIFTRPILEIDLNKLLDNYNYLKTIAPKAVAASVIKDDAYGLGAAEVAAVLHDKGNCKNFFVAYAKEGEKIYPYVKDSNIYVLQGMGEEETLIFNKLKLIPVINSLEQLEFWKKNKIEGVKPAVHIDTGLNRLGLREDEIKQLSKEDISSFSLVMSHLACADVNDHFMNHQQLDEFDRLKKTYFPLLKSSLAASDGIFLEEKFHCDMVRLGAAVYGINTAPYLKSNIKNIIEIKAPIIQIAELKAGDYAGYSATYKASSNRKIAIVSIGYGDGYPRNLSNIGKIFFKMNDHIEHANVIGRVSMDNIICDITNIENLKVGDISYIIDDHYNVDDMGADSQTIGYEILSRFGKNPRFYRKYIK
ncbi:MAG: alanine racemase [Lactobacillaceae bacterium]|jgi:alanine racemase|nr:alanine racemase [Lactobacillaceae bacterium]